jgi:hypothetical protein
MAIVKKDSSIAVPENIMRIKVDDQKIRPPFLISESNVYSNKTKGAMDSKKQTVEVSKSQINQEFLFSNDNHKNIQMNDIYRQSIQQQAEAKKQEDSIFTEEEDFIAIPYLPFFSDCEYFGSKGYLALLFETNEKCVLKTVE